jgi:uncharacterized protein YndB with AHSA1/START domain
MSNLEAALARAIDGKKLIPRGSNVEGRRSMARSTFDYVTYIRTTSEELWSALTRTEAIERYHMGYTVESEWTVGSTWRNKSADGSLSDSGEIVESDPPRHLVIKWRNEGHPTFKDEGYSRCLYDIEPVGKFVKLSITHSMERPDSKFIEAVSAAWPLLLSNLKSFLETGEPLFVDKPK